MVITCEAVRLWSLGLASMAFVVSLCTFIYVLTKGKRNGDRKTYR